MPFVIATVAGEPEKFDMLEWCELQSDFNLKGSAPPPLAKPDVSRLEVCDNCKRMVQGTVGHHVSYEPERVENWCRECHARYHNGHKVGGLIRK